MKRISLIVTLLTFVSFASFSQDSQVAKTDSIVFDNTTYDYGTIDYGSDGVYNFQFTNKGKSPLILNNVRAACGCTTPEWPKEPIPEGEAGVIKVKYNTHIPGTFRKTIQVRSNAANSNVILTITGNVKPK